MDNLCSDKLLPPSRQQPFTGGQCECVVYQVDTTIKASSAAQATTTTGSFLAPIMPLRIVKVSDTPENYDVFRDFVTCNSGKPSAINTVRVTGLGAGGTASIGNVRRQDGQVDVCGNPDRDEPGLPPVQAPSFTVNVTTPDIRGNLNIIVPVIIFRPVVNLNLSLSPRFEFNIPIKVGNLNFSLNDDGVSRDKPPNLNIDFGDVNTNISGSTTTINNNTNNQATNIRNNVKVDTTALINSGNTAVNTNTTNSVNSAVTTINSNTNTLSSNSVTTINNNTNSKVTDLSTQLTTTNNNVLAVNTNLNTVGGALTTVNNNNTNIVRNDIETVRLNTTAINTAVSISIANTNKILTNQQDCICPPDPLAPIINPRQRQPQQTSNDDPKIQAVTITLTTLPVKGLWGGGGGSPDKQIAGWFAWKISGGGYAPQSPINYEKSVFIRPLHAIGYAYTLTNKAKGFATEYVLP